MEPKIAIFVIHGLQGGGAEKLLINLLNHLDRNLITPILVSLNDKNPLINEIDKTIAIHVFGRKRRMDLNPSIALGKLISSFHQPIVIPFGLFEYFFVKLALRRMVIRPHVYISIHSMKPDNIIDKLKTYIYLLFLGVDDDFISVCENQGRYWSTRYKIPRGRFINIYNGIDTNFYKIENKEIFKNRLYAEYNLPRNAKLVVQVANLGKGKRPEIAIASLSQYYKNELALPLYLFFVGRGSPKRIQGLMTLAERYKVSNHIRFVGAHQDVRGFYQAADFFSLTSKFETFSLAALEALSSGLPCIITDVGGAREMIIPGMNGFLVPPENPSKTSEAWHLLINNLNHFDPLTIRQSVVCNFDIQECVRKYQGLIISA